MIKKQLLVILATIVLSFSAFAQFGGGNGSESSPYQISTREHFLAISNLTKHYIQTADIVLGDLETRNAAIINGTFSGTYDGKGHSISYSVSFHQNNSNDASFGLFEEVTGTIQNLNIVNSYATLSGTGNDMNVGLICGLLKGKITNCHVMGDVNSTVTPEEGHGSDAGLIAGQLGENRYYFSQTSGYLYCCSGVGNVSGVGYAGGLIGQAVAGSIKGCSFVGSVKAVEPHNHFGVGSYNRSYGAYAGGISGFTRTYVNQFELCYVNADIEGAQGARGITNADYNNNNYIKTINVTDCFAKGTVTSKGEGTAQGTETTMTTSVIDSDIEVASGVSNNNLTTIYNSAEDDLESNGSTTKSTLNGERDDTDKTNFYFSRETGEVILVYGQNIGCEKPVFEATITKRTGSTYTYYYDVTFAESGTYEFTLKKESEIIDSRIKENTDTIRIELGRGSNNNNLIDILAEGEYEFSAKRRCTSEDDQQYTSSIATYVSFLTVRDGNNNQNSTLGMGDKQCTKPTSLSVSTTPTSATIAIEGFEANQAFRYNKDNGDYITGTGNTISLTGLVAGTTYTVRVQRDCGNENYSLPFTIEFITPTPPPSDYETIKDGLFNSASTWNTNSVPDGENDNITIKHNVQLTHTLTLSGTTMLTIDDNSNDDETETAILVIDRRGQLINATSNDILGIVEVKTPINQQKQWAFIGAPFMTTTNIKKYRLETIVPVRGSDVVVSLFNDEYNDENYWITDPYANYTSIVETGKGYFGYPFYTGTVTFTTYGDLWDFTESKMKEYDETDALYKLNKANVTVAGREGGFVPLSNPYPAKLSVSKFLDNNQVQSVHKYNYSTQGFELVTAANNTEIDIAEGFFVKLKPDVSSVTFSQTQLTAYPTQGNKSQTAEREFVELSLTADNHSSKLYFAHNEQAEQGYDIFDADKLFAMTEMTEPYFLTQGIRLVKEEVNALPYYATMNVRSYENKEVSFKANNIPQGIAVSLIDGEETIELNEGVVYTTNVSSGENANRFKVLFSQSVGLNDVEELDVEITNSNRLVNVSSTETDLQIEVYNALGQKVFATKDRNFTLNNVSAGAYVVKAFNNKASKTQKIVVK